MIQINKEIKKLLKIRNQLRKEGDFTEADKIRTQIQDLGYVVSDQENKTVIVKPKKENLAPSKSAYLVIFGSGENASSAIKIHEYVFKQMKIDGVKIAIIATPAGFQPNVEIVHEEIAQFFLEHLKNFHPQTKIIYAKSREEANDSEIIYSVNEADYLFVGPGSPTYAVNNLRDTLLYKRIINRVKEGSSMAIASAASVAFSKFALPVYEIYKVGSPLYWEAGLDLYSQFFRPLTIIPHYNNNEGGRKNDTSRCYMGKERFAHLMQKLPANEEVWGIDEHTAVLIEIKTKEVLTMGKGKMRQVQ